MWCVLVRVCQCVVAVRYKHKHPESTDSSGVRCWSGISNEMGLLRALRHRVIENASELRSRLETERGIRCVSQTDTEVIVQWIGAM